MKYVNNSFKRYIKQSRSTEFGHPSVFKQLGKKNKKFSQSKVFHQNKNRMMINKTANLNNRQYSWQINLVRIKNSEIQKLRFSLKISKLYKKKRNKRVNSLLMTKIHA